MKRTEKKWNTYLSLYGADSERWPQTMQQEARQAALDFHFAALIEEQRNLDQRLEARTIEPPRADFLDGIILASRTISQKRFSRFALWLQELPATFVLPHPALSFGIVLVAGLFIGLASPLPYLFNDKEDNIIADINDLNDGDIL